MSLNSRILTAACCAFALLSSSVAQPPQRQETTIDGVVFSLADGLQLEKVAGEGLIKWPIVADFDPQGRLVVAESGGVGWPIQEHNKQGLHKIVRLVDSDHDGKFDKRIVAADNLAFPEGVLCLDNRILVSAPPVIWELTDSDGDGVCEDREVWFDGKTVTNCANDLHGPYLGRDGWVYWCKGAFGEQTHTLLDGSTFQSSAAHIYRKRDDSPLIEPLISGGMDNPVEMAFIPEGEKFFTSTFLQHPGGGLRDGIAHAVYGGLHGKDHRVIEGHRRTGGLMPIMTQLGPAAPSGLICLETDHLVSSLTDSSQQRFLCAALFNLHKVTAHRLVPRGASFRTDDYDLLSTDRVDFHPTDVIEDADGSLLVLDTGGWYDLCCPTSRIDQKTAAGGIYRITSKRSREQEIPTGAVDWESLDPTQTAALLGDRRPWIRRRANQVVVQQGDRFVQLLSGVVEDTAQSRDDRLNAIWTLCQIGSRGALNVVAAQLNSTDPSLVQAACHVASIHRDQQASSALRGLLDHRSPQVCRAAAEALGRIGDVDAVERLLLALERSTDDRHLDHSFLFALMELASGDREVDLRELATTDKGRYAAILVADQLGRGPELDPDELFSAVRSDFEPLRTAAIDVLSSNPTWSSESAARLAELWSRVDSDAAAGDVLTDVIAGWQEQSSMETLVGQWLDEISSASAQQQSLLATNLNRFSKRQLWPSWSEPLAKWMGETTPNIQAAIAESLSDLDLSDPSHTELSERIIRLASDIDDLPLRLKLLAALPEGTRIENSQLEEQVIDSFLQSDGGLTDLSSAVLLRCKLSKAEAERIVADIDAVPPQHLMTAIESVHRSGIAAVETAMLDRLRGLPAARTLPRGFLTNLYKRADPPLRSLAARTTEELESPPEDVQQAVSAKLSQIADGDPVRGLQVFRSQKAACSGCHRMGYIGKEIGPELTRIGRSRTASALLEAILYPSARLEQSYQSTRILTVDGQIHNGLVRSQNPDVVELQLNAERTITIPQDDIERMEPSTVSVMPQGIEQLLSKQELADLLALLQAAK